MPDSTEGSWRFNFDLAPNGTRSHPCQLGIGLQESKFIHRCQVLNDPTKKGPAVARKDLADHELSGSETTRILQAANARKAAENQELVASIFGPCLGSHPSPRLRELEAWAALWIGAYGCEKSKRMGLIDSWPR